MLTFVGTDDNINLAPPSGAQILIKQNSKNRSARDMIFSEIISPTTILRKAKRKARKINFLTESLILAQDERWRRA